MRFVPSRVLRCDPITLDRFQAALTKTLAISGHGSDKPRHLALAVSGGVDSMVLAVLMGQLCIKQRWQLTAITIDHGARSESDEEARWVEHTLSTIHGIPTIRRCLIWPDGMSALDRNGFETRARQLRYQALGRACISVGARHLLTGHHRDDKAESVLQRLVQGAAVAGLGKAMQPTAAIPECEGIYGADASGMDVRFPTNRLIVPGNVKRYETGGITLVRPLLDFTKTELYRTAEELKIGHREDATNNDPTLTIRNAARHFLQAENLPQALRPDALVSLSYACRKKHAAMDAPVTELISRIKLRFDPQAAALEVTFPPACYLNQRPEEERATLLHILASMLRILISVVSDKKPRFRRLQDVAREMFQQSPGDAPAFKSFHAAGALFTPLFPSPAWSTANGLPSPKTATRPSWRISPNPDSKFRVVLGQYPRDTWSPPDDFRLLGPRHWIRLQSGEETAPQRHHNHDEADARPNLEPLSENSNSKVTILGRCLNKTDIESLQARITPTSRYRLQSRLKEHAPGSTRFALPVLAVRSFHDPSGTQDGEVIALPTIGWSLAGAVLRPAEGPEEVEKKAWADSHRLQRIARSLHWQVRYRNLHPDIISALRNGQGQGADVPLH